MKRETGNEKTETENQKQETRNRKREIGNEKLNRETKLETFDKALEKYYPFLIAHTAEAYVVRPTVALVLVNSKKTFFLG